MGQNDDIRTEPLRQLGSTLLGTGQCSGYTADRHRAQRQREAMYPINCPAQSRASRKFQQSLRWRSPGLRSFGGGAEKASQRLNALPVVTRRQPILEISSQQRFGFPGAPNVGGIPGEISGEHFFYRWIFAADTIQIPRVLFQRRKEVIANCHPPKRLRCAGDRKTPRPEP